MLKKNKAQCLHCGDIIESKRAAEFVTCKCFENKEDTTGIFIDGGRSQGLWRVGGNIHNFKRLTE